MLQCSTSTWTIRSIDGVSCFDFDLDFNLPWLEIGSVLHTNDDDVSVFLQLHFSASKSKVHSTRWLSCISKCTHDEGKWLLDRIAIVIIWIWLISIWKLTEFAHFTDNIIYWSSERVALRKKRAATIFTCDALMRAIGFQSIVNRKCKQLIL